MGAPATSNLVIVCVFALWMRYIYRSLCTCDLFLARWRDSAMKLGFWARLGAMKGPWLDWAIEARACQEHSLP
jgi:hypothetical protein